MLGREAAVVQDEGLFRKSRHLASKGPEQELLWHLLAEKIYSGEFTVILIQSWYLLGVKNISSHTHKTASYLGILGILF